MTPRATVIDTDPGIDDAIAILLALASPEFDIRGIVTVAGNVGIDTTTRNAGRLLAFAGRNEVPVIAGADAPLLRARRDEVRIHGGDGLGGVRLPEPAAEPVDAEAARWLADLLESEPSGSVDLLALGPLTNLARLLGDRPAAARRIGRVIAMGGAVDIRGNVGRRSEFNIASDPEAADIVFRAGLDLTLIPLDVTRQVRADRAYVARLAAAKSPSARIVAELIAAYFVNTEGDASRPLHDPCVMLRAMLPELFRVERRGLAVDMSQGEDAGALGAGDRELEVAMGVDGQRALALLAERLSSPQSATA